MRKLVYKTANGTVATLKEAEANKPYSVELINYKENNSKAIEECEKKIRERNKGNVDRKSIRFIAK